MAIMSETPVVAESASLEQKVVAAQPPEIMALDSQVNGTKGHVEPPPTPSAGVVKAKGDSNGGDIHMEEADALLNGKSDEPVIKEVTAIPAASIPSAPQISVESSTVNPIEETAAVPPPIQQPTSDVRDESLPANTTSEPEPMAVDEPLPEAPPSQPVVDTPSQSEQFSSAPAIKDETQSTMSMSQSLGQVRPREEDDEDEHSAKRAKLTPEGETSVGAAPPDPTTSSTEAATMAPPALPGTAPVDWDSRPMTDFQRKFLLESLRKAKKTKAAVPFQAPVDPVALNIPTYPDIVKIPMDLSTLEDKLKDQKYATANDFWAEFELIYKNSVAFNGTQHPVSVQGQNLQAYFAKMMNSLPKGDASHDANKKKPAPPPKPALPRRESRSTASAKANPNTNPASTTGPTAAPPKPAPIKAKQEPKKSEAQLDSNGVPLIRRDSESNRPKREIIKPPPRDLPYTTAKPRKKQNQLELKFCEVVMKELKKTKHASFAYPFMIPVDPIALNIPTYHTIVKKPMDFGTVDKKLSDGAYASAKDFYSDAKLVFHNCYIFNPETDPVNHMGKQLEVLFDEQWKKKDEWIVANQPPSEPASEDESEEESEESEAENNDDQIRRMVELQKQIAALSAEVIQLSNATQAKNKSKKKEKKAKGEGGKQKRASTSSAVPAKKATKQAKTPKPKKLTLEQKRYVSEGIGMLDEVNMRKAVQMIRNGVPKLKDVHDDELELDVDEIPDHVLHELLRFVKSFRTQLVGEEDDEYEEAEAIKQHSTTQRKKSKPMSAREQENKIAQVRQQLQRFENQSGSDHGNDAAQDESSEDESSSSEEE